MPGITALWILSCPGQPAGADNAKRTIAVFCCRSRAYFESILKKAGAGSLLLTTGNMAPEGYIIHALAESWSKGEGLAEAHEKVAEAYNSYQKCGFKGALALFHVSP